MKVCVVIPTYNEEKTISGLVRQIRTQKLDVLVVDDGSRDDSEREARSAGASVIRNAHNQGKGKCLIKGFNYALTNKYDAVITMDGDGQHLPKEIPHFIQGASLSRNGVVVGNRMRNARNMPRVRFLTNKVMSGIISIFARQNIPDTQCGFRLIKKEVLEQVKLTTSKYETESEILIEASRLGFTINSIDITTIYNGQKSQIHPFIDTWRFVKFITRCKLF